MPNNKRVLTNGCSFTAPSTAYRNWTEYLPSNWQVTNIASHAAGNQWICDSTIIKTMNADYDLVLIMWSGLTRIDMPVNKTTWDQFWQFKNQNDMGLYYGHCGIGDSPYFPMADITKPIIKFSGEKELVFQSIMNMLKLQSWLESKNIDYRFMSFMNYWKDSYFENGLEYPSVTNLGLDRLINEINFSKWIFSDDSKNGIFELAKNQNLCGTDNVHPNSEAGKLWANHIIKEIEHAKN